MKFGILLEDDEDGNVLIEDQKELKEHNQYDKKKNEHLITCYD